MTDDNTQTTSPNAPARRTIGVMFGSYNPPHLGHVQSARQARIRAGADEIIMVPINSFFKTRIAQASYADKIAMCEILANDNKSWLRVLPITDDLDGAKTTSLSTYFNFFSGLKERHPQDRVLIVCGDDNGRKMKNICTLINGVQKIYKSLERVSIFNNAASGDNNVSELLLHVSKRAEIESALNGRSDVSSSKIRAALKDGQPISSAWMHEDVLDYIQRKNLYPTLK
ncbi:hypothetical protein [Micavibrio aeruginosavorus]|uniref:hypothetical protein n=1 Tax=Micavibrio aeruginosavorus TaxID=349221 RepID=UPI003F4AE9F2